MAENSDWDPGAYDRFRGPRLRPALDLLHAAPTLPQQGDVIDLGCGSGAVAPAMRQACPGRRLIGVDASVAMLGKARGLYDHLTEADIATWQPQTQPALIFSNAVLHWLPDHARLLPRLRAQLAPGGVLAIQMPGQNAAPSHRLWLDLLAEMFPGRAPEPIPGIEEITTYQDILPGADLWETLYHQRLPASAEAHPVRAFSQSTFARPVLAVLTPAEQALLTAEYDRRITEHYPQDADGSVRFAFRRVFIIARQEP